MQIERPTVKDDELGLLLELARDKAVLELGAGYGWSTVELAKVARVVVSVDWHHGDPQAGEGDTLRGYLERVEAGVEAGKVVPVVARFERVLPLLRPAAFDLIFHDGYHTAEAVEADLRLALPLLGWGGWIAAHDYGLFGVRPGTLEVLGEPDLLVRSLAAWGPNLGRWHI